MQANAAVRGRPAQMADLVAAVNCKPATEEDRIGHWRIVIFFGEPYPFEPFRMIRAIGGAVARPPGRHGPFVARHAVDFDGHPLLILIDVDDHIRFCATDARGKCGGEHEGTASGPDGRFVEHDAYRPGRVALNST